MLCVTLLSVMSAFSLAASPAERSALTVRELRCEYRVNPLGIDARLPRLSWILGSRHRGQRQDAYRVLVASRRELLQKDAGDVWDSGKRASTESVNIAYGGRALVSGQRCWWKVRVWDEKGVASPWSEPAWWEMGLLSPDAWEGRWLSDGKPVPSKDEDFYRDDPAPLFRTEFTLDRPIARARLYITGLGYYEAWINGKRVGDHALDPGWTNYAKRILYSTYDVTDLVAGDRNCIGVMLGNGWYNLLPLRCGGVGISANTSRRDARPSSLSSLLITPTAPPRPW